jgi:uncharacterized protein YjbI with pentapeptide repeats
MIESISLGKSVLAQISRISETNEEAFDHLVKMAGLSVDEDLQGCDLSEVDFSNCDLRGWNLRDCNLSRSFGYNIKIDDTTDLSGADLTDSVFLSYQYFSETLKRNHLSIETQLNSDWFEETMWAVNNLKSNITIDAQDIAVLMFKRFSSLTAKKEIIDRLATFSKDGNELSRLVEYIIINSKADDQDFRAVLNSKINPIGKNLQNYRAMKSMMYSSPPTIGLLILQKLLYSAFCTVEIEEYKSYVEANSSPAIRRIFLRRVIEKEKIKTEFFYKSQNKYIDYRDKIEVEDSAWRIFEFNRYLEIVTKKSNDNIARGRNYYVGLTRFVFWELEKLNKYGIFLSDGHDSYELRVFETLKRISGVIDRGMRKIIPEPNN